MTQGRQNPLMDKKNKLVIAVVAGVAVGNVYMLFKLIDMVSDLAESVAILQEIADAEFQAAVDERFEKIVEDYND